jgi:hypothetical protein
VGDALIDVSDLSPDQQAQFREGCRVMLPVERARLERALARHLREGTSKQARAIPKEGIESVALSLSGALWGVRAWVTTWVGLVIVLPTHGVTSFRLAGFVAVAAGVILYVVGAVRLALALKSRNRFRRRHLSS